MYVEENIQKDMLVKANDGYMAEGWRGGDIGRVVSNAGDDSFVQVKWVKSMRTTKIETLSSLDLITPPITFSSFLEASPEKE